MNYEFFMDVMSHPITGVLVGVFLCMAPNSGQEIMGVSVDTLRRMFATVQIVGSAYKFFDSAARAQRIREMEARLENKPLTQYMRERCMKIDPTTINDPVTRERIEQQQEAYQQEQEALQMQQEAEQAALLAEFEDTDNPLFVIS